jgi:hypothetical protein
VTVISFPFITIFTNYPIAAQSPFVFSAGVSAAVKATCKKIIAFGVKELQRSN